VHKAIPRVSPEIVDRRQCKNPLSRDDAPRLAMDW